MADPVAELAEALRAGRPPPLAWIVRWSDGPEDPVLGAWRASDDHGSMIEVLRLAGAAYRERRAADAVAALRPDRVRLHVGSWALASAVRDAVPIPPTLAELLVACVAAPPYP